MIIDLRSDTVTKPSKAMLEAMMQAEVGDDVFGEDPSILALEQKMATLFGHEAALFCASGTMSNQIAIKAQTQPMDEIIAHELCHIYYYETGGYAFNSGVSIKLCNGKNGIMTADEVAAKIQPDYDWLPKTSFVTIENTCNKAGGICYELETMQDISNLCKKRGLTLHLDGARVWNAIAAKSYQAKDIGPLFDSISVCFSKGLGAPVGSALIGTSQMIKKARRIRKVFGGGMRQAGILAAGCSYAVDNNEMLLHKDHKRAIAISNSFSKQSWINKAHEVETNIVLVDIADDLDMNSILQELESNGIRVVQFGPKTIRLVTHLDITDEHIEELDDKLKRMAV